MFALAHDVAPTLRAICSIDSEVMSNRRARFSGHAIMQKLHVDNIISETELTMLLRLCNSWINGEDELTLNSCLIFKALF